MQVRGDLQHLLQRRRIEFQPGLGLALDREVGGDIAALQRLARDFSPTGLQTVPPIRQSEAQFQGAAVDAAQLPCPHNTFDGALGSGESGHGGDGCHGAASNSGKSEMRSFVSATRRLHFCKCWMSRFRNSAIPC